MQKEQNSRVKLLLNLNFILVIYCLVCIGATLGKYYTGGHVAVDGILYRSLNNYHIFKTSFYHLLQGKDLYILHPKDHFDLFKYSPAFALFMGVFAWMPDVLGAVCWNLLNTIPLFFAIAAIKTISNRNKAYILWFILPELVINLQNVQSNGLMAALLIGAYNMLENRKIALATLLISFSVFIKLFGIFGFLLCLLYPQKIKSIAYSILWFLILTVVPLLVTSVPQLVLQYKSWLNMLQTDHSNSLGISVLGWLQTWFGINASKTGVLLIGIILLLLPLLKLRLYQNEIFRILYLSAILIWVVIFNHKAESPTFIIAVCGAAIWYFSQQKSILNMVLIILAFVFASLSPTDIFPAVIRKNYVVPYVLKAVPLIIIYGKIIYEMLGEKFSQQQQHISTTTNIHTV